MSIVIASFVSAVRISSSLYIELRDNAQWHVVAVVLPVITVTGTLRVCVEFIRLWPFDRPPYIGELPGM